MAKFNITVELDWYDGDGTIDDVIKEHIIDKVSTEIKNKLIAQSETECSSRTQNQLQNIESLVSERLNNMMDEFFDTPRNITDRWGEVVKTSVTVKDVLKEACDNFLNQCLDEDGKPTKPSWAKYKTRVDYIVAKSIDWKMENAIKDAVNRVKNKLEEKVRTEIKTQLGDKVAELVDLNKIMNKQE